MVFEANAIGVNLGSTLFGDCLAVDFIEQFAESIGDSIRCWDCLDAIYSGASRTGGFRHGQLDRPANG